MLTVLLLASCLAMWVDAKSAFLAGTRSALWTAARPVELVAEQPWALGRGVARVFASHAALRRENVTLKREVLELRGVLTRHDAVLSENARLRELYQSRQRAREDMLVAELVGVSRNPIGITIDKGRLRDVQVGQAVIDSNGLLGQVVETSALASRVLLVTDSSHSVPVRVLRNGVRAIAAGDGDDGLVLKNIPATLDIQQGDRLVTSGLGGRFPPGYPVGVVEIVARDPAEMFANATVRPTAALDRSRQVLVVRSSEPRAADAPGDGAGPAP